MKLSLQWLKEFVDVAASPREIAERLTLVGLEVEGISSPGEGLKNVLTATLLKCDKHPNADRLTLCEVKSGEKNYSIVCGAKNMKVGDKVALALPGAILPNGMEIKESVIRKVPSQGMLCSERELGLATESEGILILPPQTKDGLPLAQVLGLEDTFFEINVTPNRGDALSILGIARELAAAFGVSLKKDLSQTSVQGKFQIDSYLQVENQTPAFCPRYTGRLIRGVQVKPSPDEVRRRLEACGIRSINNIVDATNYVMLETGQPLHAFDLAKIKKRKLIIRTAQAGEILHTLDEKERLLFPEDLAIADGERVLALGGVMGGRDSGIEATTKDLLLESAFFHPDVVRKTSKRLGLKTESSYRFERGVDPNGCLQALHRLTELILAWGGGEASSDCFDIYPTTKLPQTIRLRSEYLNKVLGIEISEERVITLLQSLGIETKLARPGEFSCQVPTSRSDVTREIDLVEEVARLHGYNQIPMSTPKISLAELPPPKPDPFHQVRTILKGWGFSEVIHYSYTSPRLLEKFGFAPEESLTLVNPISEELSVMRPSLIPQLVETIQKNLFKGNKDLKLFELRRVYSSTIANNPPFGEAWRLALGMSGASRPLNFSEKEQAASFVDLKGYLEELVSERLGDGLSDQVSNQRFLHPRRQVKLVLNQKRQQDFGFLGQLHPSLQQELDLPQPILLAEINFEFFLTDSKKTVKFKEVSPYPTIERDLNLIVEERVTHEELRERILSGGGDWIQQITLFDIYRGEPLPQGKKAMTYRLKYGSLERTLTDAEVNEAREKLLAKLNQEVGATLR